MTDFTGAVYAKNETELLGPIKHGAIYDKNQTRQQHKPSYRCGLRQKQY